MINVKSQSLVNKIQYMNNIILNGVLYIYVCILVPIRIQYILYIALYIILDDMVVAIGI